MKCARRMPMPAPQPAMIVHHGVDEPTRDFDARLIGIRFAHPGKKIIPMYVVDGTRPLPMRTE